uniref:Uncharacterized protein n=1 Tax=Steinernema glaseri TaxID=37863 RepID=A0A1I7ZIV4_9BILA
MDQPGIFALQIYLTKEQSNLWSSGRMKERMRNSHFEVCTLGSTHAPPKTNVFANFICWSLGVLSWQKRCRGETSLLRCLLPGDVGLSLPRVQGVALAETVNSLGW